MFACWDPLHKVFLYNRPGCEALLLAPFPPHHHLLPSSPLHFGNSVSEVLVTCFDSCAMGTRVENSGGRKFISS